MIQQTPTLLPKQIALQQLALRQLESLSVTLQRIVAITNDQGDREAVQDAVSNTVNSQYLLREWFGTEPETPHDD